VKAIISLGHGIGATVIAEGIQTDEEARALQAMGVDYGQGFFLARPDPGPE
jgi:EAL domain-containing protein (putative c-di-GMP-specific phosphodiesterase class I)